MLGELRNLFAWVVWAAFSCIDTIVAIQSECCDTVAFNRLGVVGWGLLRMGSGTWWGKELIKMQNNSSIIVRGINTNLVCQLSSKNHIFNLFSFPGSRQYQTANFSSSRSSSGLYPLATPCPPTAHPSRCQSLHFLGSYLILVLIKVPFLSINDFVLLWFSFPFV